MDFTQDSEIRIGSYLGLMKCPTPTLIESLIILLDGEEVQQGGLVSFFCFTSFKRNRLVSF